MKISFVLQLVYIENTIYFEILNNSSKYLKYFETNNIITAFHAISFTEQYSIYSTQNSL